MKGEYIRDTEYQSLRRLVRFADGETPTARLVSAALREELTARQEQMVRLYYLEQYPMREIARMLGVNPSTVSRTLQAARCRLRRALRYSSRSLLPEDGLPCRAERGR